MVPKKFYIDIDIDNLTLNEGKINGVPPDMTYSQEVQQKNENIGQTYLKTFELNNSSEILWHGYI